MTMVAAFPFPVVDDGACKTTHASDPDGESVLNGRNAAAVATTSGVGNDGGGGGSGSVGGRAIRTPRRQRVW